MRKGNVSAKPDISLHLSSVSQPDIRNCSRCLRISTTRVCHNYYGQLSLNSRWRDRGVFFKDLKVGGDFL